MSGAMVGVGNALTKAVPPGVWSGVMGKVTKGAGKAGLVAGLWKLAEWALTKLGELFGADGCAELAKELTSRTGEEFPPQAGPLGAKIRAWAGSDPARQQLVLDAMKAVGFGFTAAAKDIEVLSAGDGSEAFAEMMFAADAARVSGDKAAGGQIISDRDRAVLALVGRTSRETGLSWKALRAIQLVVASVRDEHWAFLDSEERAARAGQPVILSRY